MYINGNECYTRIVNVVKDLLEGKWEQIVIRICKDELHSFSGVYCKVSGEFKLLGEYLETGEINMLQYRDITFALGDIANEMQEELSEHKKEVWKSMVFTLMKDGMFDVEYSYEDIEENFDRQTDIWQYKKLGIVPDEETMKFITTNNI